MTDTLSRLAEVLESRKGAAADCSYVASLYHKGLNKILEKVGEESVETIIAAKDAAISGDCSDVDLRNRRSVVPLHGHACPTGPTSASRAR